LRLSRRRGCRRPSADADVIRLKGLAEAEAKQKLAEAFEKFGEAAVLDIVARMLPELAGRVAEPMRGIDKITIVDTGSGSGAARVSNYVTELMATSGEMLKTSSGIDVQELIKRFMKETPGAPAGAIVAEVIDGSKNSE
jgi:flotillin